MKRSTFAAHGTYTLSVQDHILYTTVCGPWNIEAVQAYTREMEQKIATLIGAPWGVLATIQGEAIHTTESRLALVETVRRHRLVGRCGTAILLQVDRAASLFKVMFEKLYADAGEPCTFFDDEASAQSWLNAQIAASEAAA